jgi:sugar/nucleoside kinase (ribokinase family)
MLREGRSDCYVAIEAPDGEMFAAVADCLGLEAAGERLVAATLADAAGLAAVVADGNLGGAALAALAAAPVPGALVLAAASPEKAGRLRPALAGGRARLYLNRAEAGALAGGAFADAAAAAQALVALGAAAAVVTDGPRAAGFADRHATVSLAPPAVAVRSVTGAGDTLLAAHLDAVLDGLPPEPALAAALAAAARHIQGDAP